MGKNPNRVLKPRNTLHEKILAYTQHPDYTPKSISWFMCYFNVDMKILQPSMDYLVFKRYLMKLPSGQYAVDKDVRPRVTGMLCTVKDQYFILPDAADGPQQIVSVAPRHLLGACPGDRVRVALHKNDVRGENEVLFGVVEDVIAPLSDRFCGELTKKGHSFFVKPDDTWPNEDVQVVSEGVLQDEGTFVYAESTNGDDRRREALRAASLSQQKKTISGRTLGNLWKNAEAAKEMALKCRPIRQASPLRFERFFDRKGFLCGFIR